MRFQLGLSYSLDLADRPGGERYARRDFDQLEDESMKQISSLCCAFFLPLLVLFMSTTPALAAENERPRSRGKATATTPNPKDLIGMEVSGVHYPFGWRVVGSGGLYGKHSYVKLKKGSVAAFAINEEIRVATAEKPVPLEVVRDVVLIKGPPRNPSAWYALTSGCHGPGIPSDSDLQLNEQVVFAEVIFKKCTRYSTNVLGAWLVDQNQGVIRPLSTKGLRCGNTFLDSGLFTECKFIPREW
jgi:hypothetical protein